jgi:hypothetical protein
MVQKWAGAQRAFLCPHTVYSALLLKCPSVLVKILVGFFGSPSPSSQYLDFLFENKDRNYVNMI